MSDKIHRVVIMGGGVAGLDLATHLSRKQTTKGRLQVTLIDRESEHVWKPMLHRIAAGTSDVFEQETSYVAQARQYGFVFQLGETEMIDRVTKQVQMRAWSPSGYGEVLPPRTLPYDTLILSIGSRANDFGIPGVAEYCRTIGTRSDAVHFSEEIRYAILRAIACDGLVKVGIVGGGATGVELAAELVQLADLSQAYGAKGLSWRLQVTLLESSGQLLGGFPERVADAAERRLVSLGVKVLTGAQVTGVESEGFRLKDGSLEAAELMVWAAGVRMADLHASLEGLELNRNRQIVVTPTLRTTRDENIYALGDCASVTLSGSKEPLPPTAQVADQEAQYLAGKLPDLLEGREVADFSYRDFGMLVSLGGYDAFGSLGRLGFFKGGFIKGRVAQLGHALLYRQHQIRLHGFWRGTLLWLADAINAKIQPPIRLDRG